MAGKYKKEWICPLDFLCLLYYTHYDGDWWLYLAKENVWPPRCLKVPSRCGFTLGEEQAMSRGGIIHFGRKIQKVDEYSTRFFMSALLHTLPWSLTMVAEDNVWPPRGLI